MHGQRRLVSAADRLSARARERSPLVGRSPLSKAVEDPHTSGIFVIGLWLCAVFRRRPSVPSPPKPESKSHAAAGAANRNRNTGTASPASPALRAGFGSLGRRKLSA